MRPGFFISGNGDEMIESKVIVLAALASTPAAAAIVAPAFDWNPIITALIVAIPNTLGVFVIYMQGRKIGASVNGVLTKLLTTNTEKATAQAEVEAAPTILKLSTDKATAEATIEAGRVEQVRQDKAAKGVVIIKSRRVRKPKTK